MSHIYSQTWRKHICGFITFLIPILIAWQGLIRNAPFFNTIQLSCSGKLVQWLKCSICLIPLCLKPATKQLESWIQDSCLGPSYPYRTQDSTKKRNSLWCHIYVYIWHYIKHKYHMISIILGFILPIMVTSTFVTYKKRNEG
jgi:hypothetical protein